MAVQVNLKNDFSNKLRQDSKDRSEFLSTISEQSIKIDMLYESLEKQKKLHVEKEKELRDSEVKVLELNRKIEQFRNSSNTLTSILSRQRPSGNVTGLGYHETPPPFNNNYSFLKTEFELKENSVDSTCESSSTTESIASNESSVSETKTSTLAENSKPKQAMDDLDCFKCRKHGHVASVCPNKKQVRQTSSQRTKPMARSLSPVRKQKWVIKQECSSITKDRPFQPSFRTSNPYCPNRKVNSFRWQSRSYSPPRKHVNSHVNDTVSKNDGFFKEFVYVNEKGQSRTVMAWIPYQK